MNNADLGITIQKRICDLYHITPHESAVNQFISNYNPEYKDYADDIINSIFSEIGLYPVRCLTYAPSDNKKETLSPHNFVLSDNSTLSIRTNKRGDKIAPRVVGQAGLDAFNEHFGAIAGYQITDKNQIKKVIFDHIHEMLPLFIDYLFASDYTIWVQLNQDNSFSYTIFNRESFVDIDFERSLFSFTRDLTTWKESTTLKYKGISIAEIQIHKNRTFKFRFIMNALSDLLIEFNNTTETFGITAEVAICEKFSLAIPKEYEKRYSRRLEKQIAKTIDEAFLFLPSAIKNTGAEKGPRGGNSKSSYDFLLDGNKTLSLKTNTGKMVCPPEVGQPGAETCYMYFKDFISGNSVTSESFKEMVFAHISDIMPIYIDHLFDSDYLLWIHGKDNLYDYKIFNSDFANGISWDPERFEFTKQSIEEWNESNTVKYDGVSIGEFQVHSKRSSYKFRFNMENFYNLIENCK